MAINKYIERFRITDQGNIINPLVWLLAFTTLSYGIVFAFVMPFTGTFGSSLLYVAMYEIAPWVAAAWGMLCLINIMIGGILVIWHKLWAGKACGMLGFLLWLFAILAYGTAGQFVMISIIAIPQILFWGWVYLTITTRSD